MAGNLRASSETRLRELESTCMPAYNKGEANFASFVRLKPAIYNGVPANAARKALLSPFRYPGGKTWLRPIVRKWLKRPVDRLVEPFGGSAIISLTAINEGLTKAAIILERDPSVASVWASMLNGEATWLCRKI